MLRQQSTSMIVPVWISTDDTPTQEILTYALLETQSDTTFILDDTAAALKVSNQPAKLSLSTMTSQNTIIDSTRISNLRVRGFYSPDNHAVHINQAYTRSFIPADRSHIPERKTVTSWPHLHSVSDRIPPLQSCDIGLLIGYDCPQALVPRKILVGQTNEPYAVQTILGWSVVGYSETTSGTPVAAGISCRTSVKEVPCTPRDVIRVLEYDFALEKKTYKEFSQEDIHFLNIMEENIRQRDDKHLEMPLSFKERPNLPNDKLLALMRLKHLKNKFKRDQRYFEHYKLFMNEMIQRGDAEPVNADGPEGGLWYIPHHGVYHVKKPDKLRVVFDCSARYLNASLNDHLLTGPDLTNGLAGVLCRFRTFPIAIMCDVEKMFHQFVVKDTDRDYLRFLWWEDGDIDKEPVEYRMRVHLFGAASSPGCANYGLKHLARTQVTELPRAPSFIQNDFYVDDGLTSVETEDEAIQLVSDAQQLCASGGLRLHKFISNSKRVIDSIQVSERATDIKNLDLSQERLPVECALGVEWCVEEDVFRFNVTVKDITPTRRNMLSIVSSIFDPLGFLSPFTLRGKKILQELCQNGIDWDEPLQTYLQPQWESWIADIHNLRLITIPMCLKIIVICFVGATLALDNTISHHPQI
ncbi:uncharacterized protein LOC117315432 [Pecten maximus]|uniref:uncharacterized protein LOC117315432 n=1 Tax=Pecten maximus TaxID=6579 RepID=UPI0014589BB5|nr:uncharacterized protein LOC117315432 [Pecten maximus]